jgi:hypothetical protein
LLRACTPIFAAYLQTSFDVPLLALDLGDSAGPVSATTETFNVVNPAHIAAASVIGAAIALNDVPGKSVPAPDIGRPLRSNPNAWL